MSIPILSIFTRSSSASGTENSALTSSSSAFNSALLRDEDLLDFDPSHLSSYFDDMAGPASAALVQTQKLNTQLIMTMEDEDIDYLSPDAEARDPISHFRKRLRTKFIKRNRSHRRISCRSLFEPNLDLSDYSQLSSPGLHSVDNELSTPTTPTEQLEWDFPAIDPLLVPLPAITDDEVETLTITPSDVADLSNNMHTDDPDSSLVDTSEFSRQEAKSSSVDPEAAAEEVATVDNAEAAASSALAPETDGPSLSPDWEPDANPSASGIEQDTTSEDSNAIAQRTLEYLRDRLGYVICICDGHGNFSSESEQDWSELVDPELAFAVGIPLPDSPLLSSAVLEQEEDLTIQNQPQELILEQPVIRTDDHQVHGAHPDVVRVALDSHIDFGPSAPDTGQDNLEPFIKAEEKSKKKNKKGGSGRSGGRDRTPPGTAARPKYEDEMTSSSSRPTKDKRSSGKTDRPKQSVKFPSSIDTTERDDPTTEDVSTSEFTATRRKRSKKVGLVSPPDIADGTPDCADTNEPSQDSRSHGDDGFDWFASKTAVEAPTISTNAAISDVPSDNDVLVDVSLPTTSSDSAFASDSTPLFTSLQASNATTAPITAKRTFSFSTNPFLNITNASTSYSGEESVWSQPPPTLDRSWRSDSMNPFLSPIELAAITPVERGALSGNRQLVRHPRNRKRSSGEVASQVGPSIFDVMLENDRLRRQVNSLRAQLRRSKGSQVVVNIVGAASNDAGYSA